jgi:hypothetical protein
MTFRVIEINKMITSYFEYYWCISVTLSDEKKEGYLSRNTKLNEGLIAGIVNYNLTEGIDVGLL